MSPIYSYIALGLTMIKVRSKILSRLDCVKVSAKATILNCLAKTVRIDPIKRSVALTWLSLVLLRKGRFNFMSN